MVEAGLLVAGDDIPVPYDRFRDRVMFPITDARGRVIAFGGRALEKDVPAKYLNSPETPLFHKGDNLYNLATARQATHNGAPLIVVEGYVDVIAMVTAGFRGAVAPLGTALTENQLALLWKMADEPILCFDGDRAGQKAAYRAADLALPHLQARKEPALCAAARGAGPRRSRALGRARCDRGSDCGRAAARRHALVARDRGRQLCHARTARGAGSAHRRTRQRHPRRGRAALLSAGSCRAPAAHLCAAKAAAAATAGAISAAGRRRISPRVSPRERLQPARPADSPPAAARPGRGRSGVAPGPYQAASPQLATSPIMRGQRSAHVPPRGADPADPDQPPLAAARPSGGGGGAGTGPPRGHKLRAGIIAAFADDHHHSPDAEEQAEKMRADLESARINRRFFKGLSGRSRPRRYGAPSRRGAGGRFGDLAAARRLASEMHSLLRRMKDAELALGEEPSEANLAWLRDVKRPAGRRWTAPRP